MTKANMERLLAIAKDAIARGVASCEVQGGNGVKVQGRRITVEKAEAETTVKAEVEEVRVAEAMIVEMEGGALYVNLPPMFGAAPTINGRSIYTTPRPPLAMPAGPFKVLCRVSYHRDGVVLDARPGSGHDDDPLPSKTVGLHMRGVVAEILTVDAEVVPENETPEAATEDHIQPYTGSYTEYFALAEWTGAELVQQFTAPVDLFPSWIGGMHETVQHAGGGDGFSVARVAP